MSMFSMKKGETRTLTGDGTTVEYQRGTLKVGPFRKARAWRFKVRFNLTKAGGDAALTAAQVRTFLGCFEATVSYGRGQQHVPFSKLSWETLRKLYKYAFGQEWEGADDSSTGLLRTIAAGATAVTFYVSIPFTAFGYQDPTHAEYWGVGPTQAKTLVVELKQNTVSLPTNFAVSGNITIDSMGPEDVPAKFDTWSYIPVYRELSETNRIAERLSAGLTALLLERTAVHVSTSMTSDVRFFIRGTEYYNVTLAEVITRYRMPSAYFPSDGDLSTFFTLLWAVAPGSVVAQLPTGQPVFEQVTHQLATMALSEWTYLPVSQAALERDLAEAATLVGQRIAAVSAWFLDGVERPKTHQFCAPMYLVQDGDKEFDYNASLLAGPGTEIVVPNIPPTFGARARAEAQARANTKEFSAAENAIQIAALSIPGTGTPEGLAKGSRTLDTVRAALAA